VWNRVYARRGIFNLIFAGLLLVAFGLALFWTGPHVYRYLTYGRHAAKVEFYVAPICDAAEHPVAVQVINNSSKTIEKVFFVLSAKQPGYSDNVAWAESSNDKILKPGEAWTSCYAARTFGQHDPKALKWKMESWFVTFE